MSVIRSMTGFGRARCEVGGRRLVVEARSVNHRFLELKWRIPWSDPTLEAHITQAVRKRLDRGAVTVQARDEGGGGESAPSVTVDLPLARAYAKALRDVKAACDLPEEPTLALIAAQPGVLVAGGTLVDGDAVWKELRVGVEGALDHLVETREREGEALRIDLQTHVGTLRRLSTEIAALAGDWPEELRRRLGERLARLSTGVEVDPQRLAQEVALLADRADVAEELARLGTHLDEVSRILDSSTAVGRRLDFLAQELHREVNTIGSKSQRLELQQRMLDAKLAVERIREQVQNLE